MQENGHSLLATQAGGGGGGGGGGLQAGAVAPWRKKGSAAMWHLLTALTLLAGDSPASRRAYFQAWHDVANEGVGAC